MKIFDFRVFLALIILLCMTSCGDDDPGDADTFVSISELFKSLEPPIQTYTIEDPKEASTIKGDEGTVINVMANAFTDQHNDPVTTPITVNLNEYLSLEDMFMGNVQTTSNEQILITGGSFELSFEDVNGNAVNPSPFSLQASIPVQTDVSGFENDLRYFTGERINVDGREIVDWDVQSNSETWFVDGTFNIAGLEQGLSNCDVLFSMAGESPTQFSVSIDGVTDYSKSSVWLFIDDFPSVVVLTVINDTGDALKTYENSIPKNLKATLLAIHIDDDNYLKYGSLPITVAGDDLFTVNVDFGTTSGLEALVQTITN
ncbi:MAG: hypothetical protein AAGA77_02435 [Bacteroidota bacterium]